MLLAILLWIVVKGDEPTRMTISDVPIEVVLNDSEWVMLAPPQPPTARVVFTGPVRELVRLSAERPRLILPVERVQDSVEVRSVRTGWISFDGELQRTTAEEIQPSTVRLAFDRADTRLLPVNVVTHGELPEGLWLSGPLVADPPLVRVTGSVREIEPLGSIRLESIDLGAFTEAGTASVPVDTTGLGRTVMVEPDRVEVFVPVARPDTASAADSVPMASELRVGPESGLRVGP